MVFFCHRLITFYLPDTITVPFLQHERSLVVHPVMWMGQVLIDSLGLVTFIKTNIDP
jgi:hypothetical protein